ncbi:MAG: ATP-binding protein [Thermotoga sp.]|nr:MAG: ATP-binding protein [Thermotoga sp.]
MLRSIAEHILDIAQNSVKAGAKMIRIELEEFENDHFRFVIEDDGKGMEDPKIAFDPFYTSRDPGIRKVGLGLPFLKQSAELTGGYVKLETEVGKGTKVEALFKLSSIDCPPIGDIAGVVSSLIFSDDEIRWRIIRKKNGEVLYDIDSKELKEKYGDAIRSPSFMKIFMESLQEIEENS